MSILSPRGSPPAAPRLLHEVGEALYGPRWQTDLAQDLSVSDRTIRRWAACAEDLPLGVYLDLLGLTQERALLLDALVERLKRAASPDAHA
jgi:hypothetical protein